MSVPEQLTRNTEHIVSMESLKERLKIGRPLKVKLGIDPTRPDLTLGHMVVFNKMRQFQELGHQAILVIGDYTATVGDPSGASAMRPALSLEEAEYNAQTYLQQAFQIIDQAKTTVRHNSEWFGTMSFSDALHLTRKMTVAQMLERDDFSKRYHDKTPISIVEFLYPLLQGYDSVMLEADVELGGTDQLFNLLVGRTLQKDAGQLEQIVLTTPLLVGLDGIRKMSKSLNNYIAFNDSAKDMFGKIMSISDAAMWPYYRYLLESSDDDLAQWQAKHPMDAKKHLAVSLVGRFHGQEAAQQELLQFEQVFSKKGIPADIPTFIWQTLVNSHEATIVDVLAASNLFSSRKEIRRLMEQGAVKIDGQSYRDSQKRLTQPQKAYVIQVGKRVFLKIATAH